MTFADRWLALIATGVCAIMFVLIACAPLIPSDIPISDSEAMHFRHCVEVGLVVFAAIFLWLHFIVNPRKKP